MSEDEMVTLTYIARKTGIKLRTLQVAAKTKRLTAEKRGRDWFTTMKAVQDWERDPLKRRPRKS